MHVKKMRMAKYYIIKRKCSLVEEWKQRDQIGGHCSSKIQTWIRMEVEKMDGFNVY